MSLDVTLVMGGVPRIKPEGSGIFVRDGGGIREMSREEWDAKFPGREPVVCHGGETESTEVYWRNITHNLAEMASAAGIYQHLWRPDEIGVTEAVALIDPLTEGLKRLRAEPDKFRAYDPPNGWGSYEGFVTFVADYLAACRKYPSATIRVSR